MVELISSIQTLPQALVVVAMILAVAWVLVVLVMRL